MFTIGRQLVFSLTPWSARIHAKFHVHRITQEFPRRSSVFGYGPLTLSGAIFHLLRLTVELPRRAPTTPRSFLRSTDFFPLHRPFSREICQNARMSGVWALPLSLATTYGIESLSFPPVTEMFHFTGFREPRAMYSHEDDPGLTGSGYPIRKSTGQSVSAAHRGLSQHDCVLHRLLAPRHPSCALCSLINLMIPLARDQI